MKFFLSFVLSIMISSYSFSQNTAANFTNLTGMTFNSSSSTLIKTASNGWSNGVAFSENELAPGDDGEVEYVIENSSQTKALGVTSILTPALGLKTLEHAFYISQGSLYITNNGRVIKRLGRISDGTSLKILIQSGQGVFQMSGRTIYTVNVSTSVIHYVGAVVYYSGNGFVNVKTDFPIPVVDTTEEQETYFILSKKLENFYSVNENGEFCFRVDFEKISDQPLEFILRDKNYYDVSSSITIDDTEIKYGVNIYCADASTLSAGYYVLEVRLREDEWEYARIKID